MSLKDYHLIKKITSYGDEARQLAKIANRLVLASPSKKSTRLAARRGEARWGGVTRLVTDLCMRHWQDMSGPHLDLEIEIKTTVKLPL